MADKKRENQAFISYVGIKMCGSAILLCERTDFLIYLSSIGVSSFLHRFTPFFSDRKRDAYVCVWFVLLLSNFRLRVHNTSVHEF